jgi:organic hydroperoxide reductase OsmC/OhrA
VPGIASDKFAAAVDAAKNGCPISNLMKGNVEVTVDARLV